MERPRSGWRCARRSALLGAILFSVDRVGRDTYRDGALDPPIEIRDNAREARNRRRSGAAQRYSFLKHAKVLLNSKLSNMEEQISETSGDVAERGLRYTKDQFEQILEQTEEYVRENPGRSIAYAVSGRIYSKSFADRADSGRGHAPRLYRFQAGDPRLWRDEALSGRAGRRISRREPVCGPVASGRCNPHGFGPRSAWRDFTCRG